MAKEDHTARLHAALLLTCVLLLVVLIYYKTKEEFSTKREKAQSIYDWFRKNPAPDYANYKKEFGAESNVVEYEDALQLLKGRQLTAEKLEKTL